MMDGLISPGMRIDSEPFYFFIFNFVRVPPDHARPFAEAFIIRMSLSRSEDAYGDAHVDLHGGSRLASQP